MAQGQSTLYILLTILKEIKNFLIPLIATKRITK